MDIPNRLQTWLEVAEYLGLDVPKYKRVKESPFSHYQRAEVKFIYSGQAAKEAKRKALIEHIKQLHEYKDATGTVSFLIEPTFQEQIDINSSSCFFSVVRIPLSIRRKRKNAASGPTG